LAGARTRRPGAVGGSGRLASRADTGPRGGTRGPRWSEVGATLAASVGARATPGVFGSSMETNRNRTDLRRCRHTQVSQPSSRAKLRGVSGPSSWIAKAMRWAIRGKTCHCRSQGQWFDVSAEFVEAICVMPGEVSGSSKSATADLLLHAQEAYVFAIQGVGVCPQLGTYSYTGSRIIGALPLQVCHETGKRGSKSRLPITHRPRRKVWEILPTPWRTDHQVRNGGQAGGKTATTPAKSAVREISSAHRNPRASGASSRSLLFQGIRSPGPARHRSSP